MTTSWSTAAFVVAGALAAPAQSAVSFQDMFDRYAGGDYDIVVRALPAARDYDRIERDLQRARVTWTPGWRRVHAVFFLEIAAVAYRGRWNNRAQILGDARDWLTSRPRPIGSSSADDEFEMLWHRAALAMLLGSLESQNVERYLEAVAGRIGPTPAAEGAARRIVDPRLALVHAQAAEQRLIPGAIWTETVRLSQGRTIYSTTTGAALSEFAEASRRLTDAAACEACAQEAAVRRANILLRLGRDAEAIAALTEFSTPLEDGVVRYWRELVRGRALDAAQRADDATTAFLAARALFPRAQSPLLALAVLRFRQGALEDARGWQSAVRQLPPGAEDPWWIYWHGDARFFPTLLTRLRTMAQ